MKRFFSGILSLVIALVVVELVARAIFTFVADADAEKKKEEDWFIYSKELGWERKPNFNGKVGTAGRAFDEEGLLEGDKAKFSDSTRRRILFIGDSNTFGNDQPANRTFVALVDSFLPNAVTINASGPGYTSYQGKVLFEKLLKKFTPDVVVISFNFNDRRYVLHRDDVDGQPMFVRTYSIAQWERWRKKLENSYAFRSVRFTLSAIAVLKAEEPANPVSVDSLVPRVGIQEYQKNLTEMAQAAHARNIPALFLILKDNLVETQYVNNGISLLNVGNYDAAIENLTITLREYPMFSSIARLYLQKCFLAKGDTESARQIAIIQKPYNSLLGGYPLHPDNEYNHIMRGVGQATGTGVIDAGEVLEKHPSVYYDFCHFDTTGHRMIAELLAPHLRRILQERR